MTAPATDSLRHLPGVPKDCGLIPTVGFRMTGQVLKQAVRYGEIMAVVGSAGLGKTFAVDYHVRASRRPWLWVQVGPAPTPKEVTARLFKELTGTHSKEPLYQLTDDLVDELKRDPHIVVVDEAQNLNRNGIHQVRLLHDLGEGAFPLILTGGEGCAETLSSDPQLADRVGGWVRFAPISRDKLVGLLSDYHPFYAATDPKLLLRVDGEYARGVLRRWARLLKTARHIKPHANHLTPDLAAAVLAVLHREPNES